MGFKNEIEKKFLINGLLINDLIIESTKHIEQTYLAVGNEEVRVRKIVENGGTKYTLTIKRGKGLSRNEFETEIEKDTYLALLKDKNLKPLQKTRKVIRINGLKFELDHYTNEKLRKLVILEKEFESKEAAKDFTFSGFNAIDITDNSDYKNQNLWLKVQ